MSWAGGLFLRGALVSPSHQLCSCFSLPGVFPALSSVFQSQGRGGMKAKVPCQLNLSLFFKKNFPKTQVVTFLSISLIRTGSHVYSPCQRGSVSVWKRKKGYKCLFLQVFIVSIKCWFVCCRSRILAALF